MLNITLKEGDYFVIGDDIRVSCISSSSSTGERQTFIGIDAPRDMRILSRNYYEAKVRKQAAKGKPEAQVRLPGIKAKADDTPRRLRQEAVRKAKMELAAKNRQKAAE